MSPELMEWCDGGALIYEFVTSPLINFSAAQHEG